MADPAARRMSVDEFLRWDDGTETHYELVGDFPLAMAPPAEAHRILNVRLVSQIDPALSRGRPCNPRRHQARPSRHLDRSRYRGDLRRQRARPASDQGPFLIVEILSPNTERDDRRVKLPVYCQIESIAEILLIASDEQDAELHRRVGAQWVTDIVRGREAAFVLASVGIEIPMSDLYDGIRFGEGDAG
jgi:Uma2 family endonuclease